MSEVDRSGPTYEVRVESGFRASHRLTAEGTVAELHEHDWKVAVRARSHRLDRIGLVVDFRRLRAATDEALAELEGETLEEHEAFAERPPTPEVVAAWLIRRLEGAVPGSRVWISAVEVEADSGLRFEVLPE